MNLKATRLTLFVIAAVATLTPTPPALLGARVAHARPPTPTPVPLDGGTIYYAEKGGVSSPVHAIAPNGTGDVTLAGIDNANFVRPSRAMHNAKRWFMDMRDTGGGAPFFPDGSRRRDVFVTYEGLASPMQLTDNGGACVSATGLQDWAPDTGGQVDGAVAWIGTRWADAGNGGSPCDTAATMGVFRAELVFDGAGNVTGIVAQPTTPDFIANDSDLFTFRPDGQQVAYRKITGGQLYLAPDPSNLSPLLGGDWVSEMAWAPNGAKIALQTRQGATYGTYTINPNGTGLTLLVKGSVTSKSTKLHRMAAWSPNSTHLVYTEHESTTYPGVYRVYRIAANGSGNTLLPTSGGPTGSFALGWGAP